MLTAANAEALSRRWFAEFASTVDEHGRYVHHSSWGEPRPIEPKAEFVPPPEWDAPETIARDEALLGHMTEGDIEGLLMRLGDIHLSLVALLDEDIYERIRQVRYMTNQGAARNRLQLIRAVRAYRRANGLPPAV